MNLPSCEISMLRLCQKVVTFWSKTAKNHCNRINDVVSLLRKQKSQMMVYDAHINGGRRISADDPCYIIAEIGVNHNGDIRLAHKMIDSAKMSGADAVISDLQD